MRTGWGGEGESEEGGRERERITVFVAASCFLSYCSDLASVRVSRLWRSCGYTLRLYAQVERWRGGEVGRLGGGEVEMEVEMEMEVDEPAAALWHPPTVSGLRRLDLSAAAPLPHAAAEAEAATPQPSPKSSPGSQPAEAAASPPLSSPQPPAALQPSSSIGEHLESLEESPPPPPPPPPPPVGAAKAYGGARTFSRPSLAARFSMGAALAPPPSWPGQAALPAAAAPPLASDGAPSALAQSSAPAANASASAADGVVGEAAQSGEAGRKAKLASTRDRLQRMSLQRASLGGVMMPPPQKPEARLTRARAAAASLDPLHEP